MSATSAPLTITAPVYVCSTAARMLRGNPTTLRWSFPGPRLVPALSPVEAWFRSVLIVTSALATSTLATSAPDMSHHPRKGNLQELQRWPRISRTLTSRRRTASPPLLTLSAHCAKESLRFTPSSSFTPRVHHLGASPTFPSSNFFHGPWTSQAS